ncbi:hypothetical protein HFO56_01530 [Rhizobium laguerreae]|uniref:hypothetical protein n=1 Tax=Rhizobium laguerreae TaxID=1076926 RepID=UPI001C913701|nr:hypothetical protein [Rhizobium laguerreae]MBY3151091.1 hypothetical protein [Rhizobium laguerreae]
MPTIEFDVPYFFEAQYVPKGKRKEVPGTFGGPMKIEIECATSAEAALVLTVTGNEGFRDRFERNFVEFEGEYFERSTADTEIRIADFSAADLRLHHTADLAKFAAGAITEKPDGEFYSVEGCYDEAGGRAAIEAKKEEVREIARTLIFVDGILHRRAQLPTINASIEYRMSAKDVISIRLGETDEKAGAHSMTFDIGDLASAETWANDRAQRERDAAVYRDVEVDVHLPHLLPKTDIMAREMIRIGQFLIDDDIDLKKQSDEVIAQWTVARRAFNAAATSLDEDAITEMLETWQKFYEVYEVCENANRSRYHSSYRAADDIRYKALMGANVIWENRPILRDYAEFTQNSRGPAY